MFFLFWNPPQIRNDFIKKYALFFVFLNLTGGSKTQIKSCLYWNYFHKKSAYVADSLLIKHVFLRSDLVLTLFYKTWLFISLFTIEFWLYLLFSDTKKAHFTKQAHYNFSSTLKVFSNTCNSLSYTCNTHLYV